MDRAGIAASGLTDLPALWARPGSPGWVPDGGRIVGFPWTFAGHVRGAWRLDEPTRAPGMHPFPGILIAQTPLAFFDSASVAHAAGASAARGALAGARGMPERSESGRARSIVMISNGSIGIDESALMIERGDSLGWARGETSAGQVGGSGGWETSRRHTWGFAGGSQRGRHHVAGAYAQRGGSARLTSGEQQTSSGESGYVAYGVQAHRARAGIRVSRAYDFHESSGFTLPYARRDAQENRIAGDLRVDREGDTFGLTAEWRDTRVTRSQAGAFDASDGSVWGELDWVRPAGDGVLSVSLGGGHVPGGRGFEATPAMQYAFTSGTYHGRIRLERVIVPVWTDLAAGQAAFLQRTWIGGIEVGVQHDGGPRGARARASLEFLAGRTTHRAVVTRRPVEDLWLRAGFRADPSRHAFGLLTARAEWTGRHLIGGGEAFALVRDRSPVQPRVDPGQGIGAHAGGRFAFFKGDLGVVLRLEIEGIGPRESEAMPMRRLSGYADLGVAGVFTLANAVVTVRIRNLQDIQREQVWIDGATGVEARGPGRELRFTLTWKLFS